jgi:hypothetical protein
MFEELFGKAAFVVVHKIAPYAVERQQFLEHCREQGFTKTCLQRMAGILLAAAIDLQGRRPRCGPGSPRSGRGRATA